MQIKIEPDDKKQNEEESCDEVTPPSENGRVVRFKTQTPPKTEFLPGLKQVAPIVEDYLGCLDEAWKTVNGEVMQEDGPDQGKSANTCSNEYSVNEETVPNPDDDEGLFSPCSQPRMSSAGNSLSMALMKFCSEYGLKKDGWAADPADGLNFDRGVPSWSGE